MGIKFDVEYTPRSAAPSLDYPWGSAINNTLPASSDGSPWEKALLNDLEGFKQALWTEGGVSPSGVPDTALASDSYGAIVNIIAREIGSQGVRSFATVAAMVAATNLVVGDLVVTKGYLAAGIGGAMYRVVAAATGTPDGGEFINLPAPTVAVQAQLIPDRVVRSSQFGAVGDGSTDDSNEIQALIDAFKNIDIDTNSKVDAQIDFDAAGLWNVLISNEIKLGAIAKGFEVGGSNCNIDFIGGGKITGDGVTAAQIGIDVVTAGALANITEPIVASCLGIGIKIDGLASTVDNPQISSATNTAGILVAADDVKVRNPICTSCADGIIVEAADYVRLENPSCTGNAGSGIRLQPSSSGAGDGSKYTTIIAARCTGNTGASDAGIFIQEDCHSTEIIHPVCNGNTGNGIQIQGIAGFEGELISLESPVCDGNTLSGIRVVLSEGLEIKSPTLINNTIDGLFDTDSIDVKVLGGVCSGNTANGIRVESSQTVLYDGVTSQFNGGRGIFITDSGSVTPGSFRTINCNLHDNASGDWAKAGVGLEDAKAFRCVGFVTENGGSESIVSASSIIVPHGLSGIPARVLLTRTNNSPVTGSMLIITASTSTTFTVSVIDSTGALTAESLTFDWDAQLFA